MMTPTTRTRTAVPLALLATALLTILPISIAEADTQPDDELQQVIDPNQAQGSGRVVLDDGHIDYGPTLNTGEWIIQIHDDTAQPSFWRMPSEVVAKVNDGSRLMVPDDPVYGFLGLEAGTEAWVIPQVRKSGVIWAGWNTQEPTVLDSLSLGATQRILSVDGPGEVTVYLQSGNFGEPEKLWSTLDPFPQESWIEVNTHTHANWVFSEPGIYLVELEFEGQLVDGSTAVARDVLRFAVGDATDPEAAFDAHVEEAPLVGADAPGVDEAATDLASEADSNENRGLDIIIGILAGGVAVTLLVAILVIVIASRRAKDRVRAARASGCESRRGEGA